MTDLLTTIERAFHYRGDVTIHLKDGTDVVGYIFNRNPQKEILALFLANASTPQELAYQQIERIEFTGEDTAAGKSWKEWQEKKAANK